MTRYGIYFYKDSGEDNTSSNAKKINLILFYLFKDFKPHFQYLKEFLFNSSVANLDDIRS